MAKTIKVWSGTEWVNVGIMAAIPPDYVTQSDLIQRKKEVSASVSSNITAQVGYRYFVDTSSERTITLHTNRNRRSVRTSIRRFRSGVRQSLGSQKRTGLDGKKHQPYYPKSGLFLFHCRINCRCRIRI